MFCDARRLAPGALLQGDVCIVGAGAAGLSLALALRHAGLKIVVLESGGWSEDAATQALYEGEVAPGNPHSLHTPLHTYRKRMLGGSTTIWGGRCMPMDPIDFEVRRYLPHSGWPIAWADLLPYYRQANELLEAGDFDYSAASALPRGPALIAGFQSDQVHTDAIERFSCPTNLARRYRRRLAESAAVEVWLHANCVKLAQGGSGPALSHLECRVLNGPAFKVQARRYVLATGGLEVPRLLLASCDLQTGGVGNEHDVVGRYYMAHLASTVGRLQVRGPRARVSHGYGVSAEGVYCRRRLTLPAAVQRELGIGNAIARLHFPGPADPAHCSGVLSALFLAKPLISFEYGRRLESGAPVGARGYLAHVGNVLSHPGETAGFALHWLRRRTLASRKFPSVVLPNRSNLFSLDVHGEQAPNPDSRVTLAEGRDALGLPRLRVAWRHSQIDVESIRAMLRVLAREFARSGVGELDFDDAGLEAELLRYGVYGGHHIGTARMGSDPRSSVVDADCRLHAVPNLHVAGSAVFPTSSQATPTLTIVALALRLADHLRHTLACEARA